jgi:zinc/manganese transport system permease protein
MQASGRGFDASSLLYGNVLSLYREEIYGLFLITVVIILLVAIFSKEIAAITFHRKMAEISGIRVQPVYYLCLLLIAVMVALCLPVVGGLLLYVWLVTPAAVAYQFCGTIRQMLLTAPAVAAVISLTGAYAGITWSLPVGPFTAVLFSGVFVVSVALSPKRRVNSQTY